MGESKSEGKHQKKKKRRKLDPDDIEYRAFLLHLFHEYIEPRLTQLPRSFKNEPSELRYELNVLCEAVKHIKYAHRNSTKEESLFRPERLEAAAEQVGRGLRFSERMAEEFGVIDCLESHYSDIVDGLRLEHFPIEDINVLRQMGSNDAENELRAIIYILKRRQTQNEQHWSDRKLIRDDYHSATRCIDKMAMNISKKQERRWFKGLGQMGQGAALTIANLGLATGAINFPVRPETQTWGALVSAATGIGMVCTGFGELRGE